MKEYLFIVFSFISISVLGQQKLGGDDKLDYKNPKEYEIAAIIVEGTETLDPGALRLLSGLRVGSKIKIPGEDIKNAISNLWDQGLFSDVQIGYSQIQGSNIFLKIKIIERARMSKFKFSGIKKTEADDLRDEIKLHKEKIVTNNLLVSTKTKVKEYFIEKGFLNIEVNVSQEKDPEFQNRLILLIDVKKNGKVKINSIKIEGNDFFTDGKIKRNLKETKEKTRVKPFVDFDQMVLDATKSTIKNGFKTGLSEAIEYLSENVKIRLFKSSKYIEDNYEADKIAIIEKYNKKGYRDAKIVFDTIQKLNDNSINLKMVIEEGAQYYFGNIRWVGNKIYSTEQLKNSLGIAKGDIYDPVKLESRLYMDPSGNDISSLYMDDGYLFFQINPIETKVENNTIDLTIQIYEGQQAKINNVYVTGNTKTNDHVIMREIRTKPGQLFSRADIIRSQRELGVLGYFNAEKLGVNPKPNQADGTVDIEYVVEESPSDQIELSGGFGGNTVVGNIGVSFNNFSTRNFFKKDEWRPLPAGDGQKLSIRASSNGFYYQSANFSFTEPWLGGKKPNSFTISSFVSVQSNARKYLLNQKDEDGNKIINPNRGFVRIAGASVGLGKRLTWPDDYFVLQQEISYQKYDLQDWTQFIFSSGEANNLFYKATFSRNSQDQTIYPRLGSKMSLSFQITAPYSVFNGKDYANLESDIQSQAEVDGLNPQETFDKIQQAKYRWVEYYKWKFTSTTYTSLVGNLVLSTKVGFGFLGSYNKDLGSAPFERFYLGGSGLSGFALDGREIIALRGYNDQAVSPTTGGAIINKYTAELRYPFTLNPSATIYGLAFAEAGNTWNYFNEYNPFSVKRSAGVGIRVFLPMFGLLGLDYGWRFDDITRMTPLDQGGTRGQLHFTIGMNLGEL